MYGSTTTMQDALPPLDLPPLEEKTSFPRPAAGPIAGRFAPAREGGLFDVLALLVGCGLWGLAWWPMKALAGMGLAGPQLAIVAYGSAALVLLPAVTRRLASVRGAAVPLALIAIVGGIWNAAFMTAMIEGTASRVVLLYYVASGLAILGGRFLFREAIDGPRRVAMGLVLGGALLVLGDPEHALDALGRADVLALVAGLAHAVTNLAFRGAERTPLVLKNFAMFVGAIAAASLGLELSGAGVSALVGAPPEAFSNAGQWPDDAALLLGAAFGVGWLLLAETLTQHGVSRLPATRSAVLLVSELPFTVVSASLIAGDRLGLQALVGAALITLATWIEARRAHDSTPVSN